MMIFAGLLLVVLGLMLTKKKMGDVWKNPVDKKRLLIFSILAKAQ